jgi:hypothetical protein
MRYVDLCKRSRSPVVDLTREELGLNDIEPVDPWAIERTKWRLKEARKRGLLTPPPARGKAGGSLTDKGRRALTRCKEHDHGTHPETRP